MVSEVAGVVITFVDVSELKCVEQALRASEERFAKAFHSGPAPLCIADAATGRMLDVNDAWVAAYGYTRAESIGRTSSELGIVASEVERRHGIEAALHAEVSELHAVGKNGKPLVMVVRATAVEFAGHRCVMSASMDVTDRKRAEQEAREGRAKLEAALASMTDAVFISNAEGRFVEFNEAFATFHRFPSKAACAKTLAEYPEFLEVFLPDGTLAPLDQWAVPRALRGETVTNAEYGLRRKDTGERWVGSYSFAPIRDENHAILGSVVVGRDITDAKRAEDAIRESEAVLRGI